MVMDATAAIILCKNLGIEEEQIAGWTSDSLIESSCPSNNNKKEREENTSNIHIPILIRC